MKPKRMFEKVSAIVVIVGLCYLLLFIKVQKEIISFFEGLYRFFWAVVKGNPVTILIFLFFALIITISLINWILEKDDEDSINVKKNVKKTKKKKKKKKKIEKKEEASAEE